MLDILYVEDNANDADIFSRLMRKLNRPVTYTILSSGTEAVEYLAGKGRYKDQSVSLPKLMLLDLNLMGLSGFDVVEYTRSMAHTRYLPIVAFSTSDNPADVRTAYQAGINAYVVKPGSYQATALVLQQLYDFWLETNLRLDYN